MEEISLRELIDILLKKKGFITIFTLICIVISAVFSFFVIDPVYEAKSTFIVDPISISTGINPNSTIIFSGDPETLDSAKGLENKMLGAVLRQVRYPQIDVNKMITYMSSTEYITKVLDTLNIDMEKYDYTKNIKIELIKESNTPSISVKHNNADTAMKIKDALINYLPEYVSNEVINQLSGTEKLLNQGIDRETKNVETREKDLAVFNVEPGRVDLLPADKQGDYQKVYNNYLLANQTLDSYLLVKKEFDDIKAMDIKQMLNLKVISQDRLPLEPISPRKMMNIAIAAMLGLMISIFVVLFMEYWKESSQQTEEKTSKLEL